MRSSAHGGTRIGVSAVTARRARRAAAGLALQREPGHRTARTAADRAPPSSTGAADRTTRTHRRPDTGAVHPIMRSAAERRVGVSTAAEAHLAGYPDGDIRSSG